MKMIPLLLLFVLATQAQAERLLRCNPPMGSGLQEVEIVAEGGQLFVRELNFAGSASALKRIANAGWVKKDLRWTSGNDGSIRLNLNADGSWSYHASSPGYSVTGYCDRTDGL